MWAIQTDRSTYTLGIKGGTLWVSELFFIVLIFLREKNRTYQLHNFLKLTKTSKAGWVSESLERKLTDEWTTGQIHISQYSLSSCKALLPTGHRPGCVLSGTRTGEAMLWRHPYLWHHQRVSRPWRPRPSQHWQPAGRCPRTGYRSRSPGGYSR